mgnify:CR=1 FL=1
MPDLKNKRIITIVTTDAWPKRQSKRTNYPDCTIIINMTTSSAASFPTTAFPVL